MSDFATEYLRVKTNIENAYATAEEKGATLPSVKNSDNLPATIESIQGGGEPPTEDKHLCRFLYRDIATGANKVFESRFDTGADIVFPSDVGDCTFVSGWRSVPLTFQGWNYSDEDIRAADRDIDVGAMYIPTSGKTVAFITINSMTTLIVDGQIAYPLSATKSDTSTMTLRVIGEGGYEQDDTTSTSGAQLLTLYFPSMGDYIVEMWISEGSGTYSFGRGIGASAAFGAASIRRRDVLTQVFIGKSVPKIGSYGFYNHRSLTDVTIPNGTDFSGNDFTACTQLINITIPNGVKSYSNSFNQCRMLEILSFPNGVTQVNVLFTTCERLAKIVLPNSVTELINNFNRHVKSVFLSNGLEIISANLFSSSTNLKYVNIPNGIKEIQEYAFQECSSLESVHIPDSVTSIGLQAFFWCPLLKVVTFQHGLTSIGDSAFADCTSLENIQIPDSVTSIGNSAFASCSKLKSANLPNGLTKLDGGVFASCVSLERLDIPESVTEISVTGLPNNNYFNEFPIPSNVISVQGKFREETRNCVFNSLTPPTIPTTLFDNLNALSRIYVPDESLELYKTASAAWIANAAFIHPMSEMEVTDENPI